MTKIKDWEGSEISKREMSKKVLKLLSYLDEGQEEETHKE
jgi:hypothetical protein